MAVKRPTTIFCTRLRGLPTEMEGASAPRVQINNLDRLVTWSNEFLERRDNERVYPVPIIKGEQTTRDSSTTVDMNVDEENNKGCQPRP